MIFNLINFMTNIFNNISLMLSAITLSIILFNNINVIFLIFISTLYFYIKK